MYCLEFSLYLFVFMHGAKLREADLMQPAWVAESKGHQN
jgi:hypothetical protein